MKEDVKVKFIDALLSGKYTQIRGRLRMNDGVCANGVLCELAMLDGVNLRHGRDGYGYLALNDGVGSVLNNRKWQDVAMIPPKSVMEWAGVDKNWIGEVMKLNDGNGKYRGGRSFEDIAEIIKNGGLPE